MDNAERLLVTRSITRTVASYYASIHDAGGSVRGPPMTDEMVEMLAVLGSNNIVFRYEPPCPSPWPKS